MTPLNVPGRHPLPPFLRPLVRFLHTEAAGGVVLLVCAIAAIAWANSPWADSYFALLKVPLDLTVGGFSLARLVPHADLKHLLINDGLMTLFFFVVGLEIKRELISGELRDPRKAALPAAAALGGMIAPALVYLFLYRFVLGGNAAGFMGWGVPMATDIAFVVGVLALLGPRVPAGLKIMLLSLAIVDDLGAVLVIALVYSGITSPLALALAAAGLGLALALRLAGVRRLWVYVLLGVGVWFATLLSGIHPTIAGVALGLLTPAVVDVGKFRLLGVMDEVGRRMRVDADDDSLKGFDDELQALAEHTEATRSPLDRIESALHPWVAFGIMPLFAFANAGVPVKPSLLFDPVAVAVALGLLLGKPLGIFAFSWASARLGVARLPGGVGPGLLLGGGFLGGIGFTMSLFITELAFKDSETLREAGKVGTLTGSVLSALVGAAVLLVVLRRSPREPEPNDNGMGHG